MQIQHLNSIIMTQRTFHCDKLVRSRAAERMEEEHIQVQTRKLSAEELIQALRKKIIEEAQEAAQASCIEKTVEELADLAAASHALYHALGYTQEAFEKICHDKMIQKGDYSHGILLTQITLDDTHPKFAKYQSRPERYQLEPLV